MTKKLLTACVCLCLATGTLQAQNEDRALVATARKTLETYGKAVISLSVVIKIEGVEGVPDMGLLNRERKTRCVAAIIDAGGLAVTSLTNLNSPGSLPQIRISRGGGTPQPLEVECHVQEVKYRLADGTELPARVVLKDEDLDLAFLAPQKPLDEQTRSKIAALSLGDAAPQAELLDATILLNRANDNLNYVPMLNLGRIVALLSKPRICYVGNTGALGTPVFDRQGKILGIVCRCMREDGAATSHLILPAADVARLVPQAKEEIKSKR